MDVAETLPCAAAEGARGSKLGSVACTDVCVRLSGPVSSALRFLGNASSTFDDMARPAQSRRKRNSVRGALIET